MPSSVVTATSGSAHDTVSDGAGLGAVRPNNTHCSAASISSHPGGIDAEEGVEHGTALDEDAVDVHQIDWRLSGLAVPVVNTARGASGHTQPKGPAHIRSSRALCGVAA